MDRFNAIITYTISKDDIRNEFIELIEEIGFKEQDDQSTYAIPARRPHKDSTKEALKEFCDNKLQKGDLVDYYWLGYQLKECIGMVLTKFRYVPKK